MWWSCPIGGTIIDLAILQGLDLAIFSILPPFLLTDTQSLLDKQQNSFMLITCSVCISVLGMYP